MRLAIDSHSALFHNLEQGRLRLCAGAVDLIAQQHIAINRTPHKAERAGIAIVHRKARNVRGQCVGRKLHALKVQAQRTGQCQCQRGLAGAGHILEQDMAASVDGHQGLLDHVTLAQ